MIATIEDQERAAIDEKPPELVRDTLWRDTKYMGSMFARYLANDPWLGSALIVLILGASIVTGYMAILTTVRWGALMDALATRDGHKTTAAFVACVLSLLGMMLVQILTGGARYIFTIRWQGIFTLKFIRDWMAGNRFYHLQREGRIENPEQRIQEDVFLVVDKIVVLMPQLITIVVTFVLAIGVLWKLSKPLPLGTIGLPFSLPAHLMTSALIFGVVWTIGAHFAGKAITRVEIVRQRLNADFRHGLGQVREHGEAIAFEAGAAHEKERADAMFSLIRRNWWKFTGAQIRLLTFNLSIASILERLLPVLLSIPQIMAGEMTIGQLLVVIPVFQTVVSSLSFFALSYAEIATLRAGVARIRMLEQVLAEPLASGIAIVQRGDRVAMSNLAIDLPDGRRLLDVDQIEIGSGERVLVRGRSGSGKSTMMRVLGGLWPNGSGSVEMPARDRVMFLPQRGYMPDGTLTDLLAYPGSPEGIARAALVQALQKLSLGAYVDRLDEKGEWRRILSPGEQQRFAAARALLRAPDFLFLDEATSALDSELEAELYEALAESLPNTAIISVAHRPTVARFHDRAINIAQGRAVSVPI
ncbi:ABC transporter ATP-binding protein/permease [Sphingomonas sp.]|uniref:ABC transporter ATP-binding protein/permease n=1 Tax=Sphingomonas sp. TaxID=28214 RepID=UPI003D6CD3B6